MNAGDLRERVQLLEKRQTQDGATGELTYTWRPVAGAASIPCGIVSTGSESLRGKQISATASHVITMRYRTDITAEHALQWGDRRLYVRSAEDPDGKRRKLEVVCGETADG